MAYTIMLDAGHGGSDPGAVYNGRQEKDDALRLTLAVGEILSNAGYHVLYTRTSDIYESPTQKANEANSANADLFVSIHRNSNPTPNSASGIEVLVYDASGLKLEVAQAISEELVDVGYNDLGIKERPNLTVLKRTQMPALLVEVGFINSDADNQLFDDEFDAIAQGIADGIMNTVANYGGAPDDGEGTDEGVPPAAYRVQTGAYRNRGNAERMFNELIAQDYPAEVVAGNDGFYRVQVGSFSSLDDAVRMERRLKQAGYPTIIVR